MSNLNHALAAAVLAACLSLSQSCFADPASAARLAMEAKEALDAHYGRQAQLTRAAELLTRALAENKDDASIYVQAARLSIKGGHLVALQFRTGTLDAYGELIDRALSIDPRNAKALILKAEHLHFRGDHVSERKALDKAKQIGTSDAWLLVGYGRLHEELGDAGTAFSYLSEARDLGPGKSLEQRSAYVVALNGLGSLAATAGDEPTLKELMVAIRKGRDPRDAWALGNLAGSLVWAGMFDEAISVSREALRTMDYGAGRLTLTAALFGKAAELAVSDNKAAAAPLLTEAIGYGYTKSSVLGRFNRGAANFDTLARTVEKALE